ncbi:hypothetical protein ABIC63_002940 [Pseudacidovorax sp. 1753]|uniref:hypothetical protein n=1 Tax=Pseudacidovorax sp. 1753 TaxID=3156419 RepID=UPI0033988827
MVKGPVAAVMPRVAAGPRLGRFHHRGAGVLASAVVALPISCTIAGELEPEAMAEAKREDGKVS